MPTSAAGSERGFTLIELLVVVAILAVATGSVALVLRDQTDTRLDREAQRLASLLDAARAQSRASGRLVRWVPVQGGFRFEGLPGTPLPSGWLDAGTHTEAATPLVLGPEPLIPPQAITLRSADDPTRRIRVTTDGLRPFTPQPLP